jgi:hypothetical protein
VQGGFLFSPSLFFNKAVDNLQPVDNFSVLIGFSPCFVGFVKKASRTPVREALVKLQKKPPRKLGGV